MGVTLHNFPIMLEKSPTLVLHYKRVRFSPAQFFPIWPN